MYSHTLVTLPNTPVQLTQLMLRLKCGAVALRANGDNNALCTPVRIFALIEEREGDELTFLGYEIIDPLSSCPRRGDIYIIRQNEYDCTATRVLDMRSENVPGPPPMYGRPVLSEDSYILRSFDFRDVLRYARELSNAPGANGPTLAIQNLHAAGLIAWVDLKQVLIALLDEDVKVNDTVRRFLQAYDQSAGLVGKHVKFERCLPGGTRMIIEALPINNVSATFQLQYLLILSNMLEYIIAFEG